MRFYLLIGIPGRVVWWLAKQETIFLAQCALILTAFMSCLDSGYYLGKWISISLAGGLEIARQIYHRYGLVPAVTLFYLLANAVWVMLYMNRYSTVNPYDLQAIKFFAVDSTWKLLLAAGVLLCIYRDRFSYQGLLGWGRLACGAFFMVSAVKVFWEWAFHPLHCNEVNLCGGSLLNPSLNAAMMAVVLPLMPFPLAFAAIAAVCSFLGKTAIGAGMVSLFVLGMGIRRRRWVSAIPVAIAILYLAHYTHGYKALFDSSGRFPMWRFFMGMWALNPRNWLFGTGFGTFGVFSVNLQHAFNMNSSDWWIWLHNDWLQSVFETGLAGAALIVWLYVAIARALWNRELVAELFSWLLFGVVLGCEYSLHIAPCCAYALWVLAVALLKIDENASFPSYCSQGD